jgi:Holliday junction resolvase RusA-like endonuclease
MRLIETFKINIDDFFLWDWNKKVDGKTVFYSVNWAYTTDYYWNTYKSSWADNYQSILRNIILYSKKSTEIYKWLVFLNIEVHKIVSVTKSWLPDERWFIDIDNVLKWNIDCLNKTIISDDDNVMWIIVNLLYNKGPNSYVKISVFEYDEKEFEFFKEKYKKNHIENIVYEDWIVMPSGMSILSYNNMYERWYKMTKLSTEALNYKHFLEKEQKKKYTWKIITENLVWDYSFYIRWGDLDNKVKAFQDSLSKNVIKDDKLFRTLFLQKKIVNNNTREWIKFTLYKI